MDTLLPLGSRPTGAAWRSRARLLTFALLYVAAYAAGRGSRPDGAQIALVWPAAVVGFLWLAHAREARQVPRSLALLVALAAACGLLEGRPVPVAVAVGVACGLQALGTAVLARRWHPGPWQLRTPRDLALLVAGAVTGGLAGALVGPTALWLAGRVELAPAAGAWLVNNVTSCLVLGVVGLRLLDRDAPVVRRRAAGRLELVAGTAVSLGGYAFVFGSVDARPLAFVLLPAGLWIALRGTTTLTALHVLGAGVLVVTLTHAGRGPFAGAGAERDVLLAQGFVTVLALVTLVLALSADEREGLIQGLVAERHHGAAQTALLETILDTVDVSIVACDENGSLTMFNRAARVFHDLEDVDLSPGPGEWPDRFDLYGEDGTTLLEPDEVPLAQALHHGRVSQAYITIAPAGQPARLVRCEGRALVADDGTPLGAVVAQTDVTALRSSEQHFRAAFEDGPTPMARLALDGTVEATNSALRRFLALPASGLVGVELPDLAVASDRAVLGAAVACPGCGPVEVRLARADGSAVWCEVTTTLLPSASGGASVLVQALDVDVRKTHELALDDLAHRDPLTGLGNRTVLDRRLQAMLASTAGTTVVLAYLDLDGFKTVNDRHGHSAGDAVLQAVAGRLLGLVRVSDVAVRLGGDEFVLAYAVPSGGAAEQLAAGLTDRVEAVMVEPVRWGELTLRVGLSVGTVLAAAGSDAAQVLRHADMAMYERKRARTAGIGRPRWVPAPLPPDEERRLRVLRAHRILDTPPDAHLDALVQAAAAVAGFPSAMVSLVDADRQWFMARCGVDASQTSRDASFCGHVVAHDAELHVEDARRDDRFADSPLVVGDPSIRAYAGFPLRTPDGFVLGSLCVTDTVPGVVEERARVVLRALAQQVMTILDTHRRPELEVVGAG